MSSKEEMESRIREQRTAEATNKGLMGQGGKIGAVLKSLGSPIVAQTQDVAYLDLGGRDDGPSGSPLKDIPIMDLDGSVRPEGSEWGEAGDALPFSARTIGWHFDGLSRSMHLEIVYKDEPPDMVVYHRGHMVYREVQGELLCYVPSKEWEGWIESLYKVAKRMQRESKEEEFKNKVQDATIAKESWLRQIASRWGIT